MSHPSLTGNYDPALREVIGIGLLILMQPD